jgi:RHS repeat-associated protein
VTGVLPSVVREVAAIRTVGLRGLAAVVIAIGWLISIALPTVTGSPLFGLLSPRSAAALCSPDPRGTGYLTTNGTFNSTSGSPQKLDSTVSGDINSATVFGYISQLNGTNDGGSSGQKSCGNPVFRYEGLAWLTNSSTATLDWGALANNGNSGACYPLWGTTDYLHANSTTTCAWSLGGNPGINFHVLSIALAPANQHYQRNASGLVNTGDFEFIWDSCSTYYQDVSGTGEVLNTGVAKTDLTSQSATSWRPGANCGNILTQDNTDTTEGFVYDTTRPTMSSVAVSGSNIYQIGSTVYVKATTSGTVTLTPSGSDPGTAPNFAGVRDYTFGAMGGTTTGWSPTGAVTQTGGLAYAWTSSVGNGQTSSVTVNVNDKANNVSSTGITTTFIGDDVAPAVTFTAPPSGTAHQTATSYSTTWTETETGSGVATRSLERHKAAAPNGVCPAMAMDGTDLDATYTNASPWSSQTLVAGYCYRWRQTEADRVGNSASTTSGALVVDSTVPIGAIDGPAANSPLGGSVTVLGSAMGAFHDYTLDFGAGVSPTSWTTITSSTTAVVGGTLATWDSRAVNGVQTLRLTVHDAVGNSVVVTRLLYLENTGRGQEAYHTQVPFNLGGGWVLNVGVANGEANLSRGLFAVPSFGPAQALSLSYSSLESTDAGHFGYGWVSNLTQYLTFESGFIVWHRADGGRVPFGQVTGIWTELDGHFEALSVGTNPAQDTITTKDQTSYVFDGTTGRLIRIVNRFGKQLTLVWGASTATATDASGRVTTLTIEPATGHILGASDSAGRSWSFGYSGAGDLTTVTDPLTNSTTLGYDASHHLMSISRVRTPAQGSSVTVLWSVGYTGNLATSVTDPVNASVSNTFTYATGTTTAGLLKTYSPLVRNTSTYTLDASGRVTHLDQLVDPSANPPVHYGTSWSYDAESNVATAIQPNGRTSAFTYDANGNLLTETTDVDSSTQIVTSYSYDSTNDLLTKSEADNDPTVKLITKFGYDGAGHLTSTDVNCTTSGTTPPNPASSCTGAGTQDASTNLITAYTWTSNDQLLDETDPLGRVTHHGYDSFGNETTLVQNYVSGQGATGSQNVTTSRAFDQASAAGKAGIPTSTTDALGVVTTYTYDALGRATTETDPGDSTEPGVTITTTYDEFGNLLIETQAWTGSSLTTTHAYDNANHETSVIDSTGVATSTTYDAAGNDLTSTAGGVTTTKTFDALGRTVTETVSGATTNTAYDPAGHVVSTVAPDGSTVTSGYDLYGNELTETTVDTDNTLSGDLTRSYSYDLLGRVLSSTDYAGTTTTYAYDRDGHVATMSVAGALTSYAYDRAGNLLSTKNPGGDVTATVVDALNRPVQQIENCTNNGNSRPAAGVVCAGGGIHNSVTNLTTVAYLDAAGHKLATKDPLGVVTRDFVNVRGLTWKQVSDCTNSGTTPPPDPSSCTGSGTADTKTNVVQTITYDGAGRIVVSVLTVANQVGATTSTAYNGNGQVVALLDARGTITRNFYDAAGRLSKTVIDCTSTGTTIPTDWIGCTGAGSQDGTYNLTTAYTYDARGNKASETGPNGQITVYGYDAADHLVAQTENYTAGTPAPDQNLTMYFAYDDAGRKIAVRAPTADRTTFTVTRFIYDDASHAMTEIDNCTLTGTTPPGDPAWKTCDGGGTADWQTNVKTTHTFDSQGHEIATTAPDPSASGTSAGTVVTRFAYDSAGRLCRVLQAATVDLQTLTDPCSTSVSGTSTQNLSTRYTYDDAGNIASMIDARGNTTTYAYDANRRLVSLTDPKNKTVNWTYDALGNRLSQSNRDNTTITWTYDGAGRPLTRSATGVATITYTYDANGNRLSAADASRTISMTYDRLNRPLTVSVSDDPAAGTSYAYSLTSVGWTDPTGTYLATLDSFGREASLSDPIHQPTIWGTTYRADGQLSSLAAPNGNTTSWAYDTLGRSTGSSTTAGQTTRASDGYTLNRAGQRLSEASQVVGDPTNGTVTFAYDPLGRITGFSGSPVTALAFAWDKVPNRTSLQVGTGGPVTVTYDSANRPTSDSAGGNYSSDSDGRLTGMPGEQFVWDSLGRLTQAKDGSGAVLATYAYDPLDRLVSVVRAGSTSKFRYLGATSAIAQARDAGGNVLWNIVHSLTGSARMDFGPGGSSQRYYGVNGHGDLTWTADSTGAVASSVRYDPFGNPIAQAGSSSPEFGFQGSWYDPATHLTWAVGRWYSESIGRFLTEDNLLGEPSNPADRNLYAYGNGDPVDNTDPDGHFWYRVQSGDTLGGIALRYWYTTSKWPTIFNANRNRLVDQNHVYAGQCIWLPIYDNDRGYVYPSQCNTWNTSPRACTIAWPSPYCITGVLYSESDAQTRTDDYYTAVAAAHFHRSWANLSRQALLALTDKYTDYRARDPSSSQQDQYWSNSHLFDGVGSVFLALGNAQAIRREYGELIIYGNHLLPQSGAEAQTAGHLVFIAAYSDYDRISLLSHEYVHTLEAEGGGEIFAAQYGVQWLQHTTDANNDYEGIAYLWTGWMNHYGPVRTDVLRHERPAWCWYKPLTGGWPAGC